jgi:gliding motility-associated-like protein
MIKFRINLLVSFLFCFGLLYSQKQNNQWRFGFGTSINFNTIPPTFPSGAALPTIAPPIQTGSYIEGTASIADRITGDLLFYTDGQTVWNAQNQPMPNGSELAGSTYLSSVTGAVIVPVPGSCSKYYIFTVGDREIGFEGIKYSLVDMVLNNGLGDIIPGQKSIFLYQNQSECIQVYPKSTQDGYWILTGDQTGLSIAAFEVNASGINTTPIISPINTDTFWFRINPQGTKLVITSESGGTYGIKLFDFDATSGIVSNPLNIPFPLPNSEGLRYFDFSPSGQYLYATSDQFFYQFDISSNNAANILASATEITTPSLGIYGMPQIGPNGKLYVVRSPLVYQIDNPNNPAASIGPITQLPFPNVRTMATLPQLIYVLPDSVFSASIVNPSDLCLLNSIPFSVQSASDIVSIAWNFGDPNSGSNNTSTLFSPSHIFSGTGPFIVQAIVNFGCATKTISLPITINSPVVPTFNTIPALCVGDTSPVLPTTSSNGIVGTWNPTTVSTSSSGTSTYTFTPNAGQCAILTPIPITITVNPLVTPTFNTIPALCVGDTAPILPTTSLNGIAGTWNPTTVSTSSSGTSTYTFTPNAGQCAILTPIPIPITVNPLVTPTFNTIPDLCVGDTAPVLTTTSLNGIVGTWNPPSISTSSSGTSTYTFTPNTGQCANPKDLVVSVQNVIDFEITGSCVSNNFVLEVTPVNNTFDINTANFNWLTSNQQSVGSNSNTFNVTQYLNSTTIVEQFPITFSVIVTPANGCPRNEPYEIQKIVCSIQKGISVNNDGKNDTLDLTGFNVKNLSIFNRYGEKVYTYQNYTNQWGGQSNNGDELPDGTYYYVINRDNGETRTGWVYINRAQ